MLGCTLTSNKFRGEFVRFSESFNRGLFNVHKMAAQAFLSRLIEGYKGNFPVWTGMAKASLKPLGRYLEMEHLIDINPVKAPHTNTEFGYWQSPETGEEMGEPDRPFLSEDHNIHGIYRVTFHWRTLVDHFHENDIYHVPRISNTPWKFVEKASAEFVNIINQFIESAVPGMKDYLVADNPHALFDPAEQARILSDPKNII